MPFQTKEVLGTYHYDALDQLIGLKSSRQDDLQRFYCKSRLATEIQGQAKFSIMQHGDQLLAQQQRMGPTVKTDLLVTDQPRSVLDTVGQSPSPPIAYSPYGHHAAEKGLTSLLGFNGERRDTITGRYLLGNGHRAFNPVLMRFDSPDTLSPFGRGGFNAYAYCSLDPINRADPTGKFSLAWVSELPKIFRLKQLKNMYKNNQKWYQWDSMVIDIVKNDNIKQSVGNSPFAFSIHSLEPVFRSGDPAKGKYISRVYPLNELELQPGLRDDLIEGGDYYLSDLMERYQDARINRLSGGAEFNRAYHMHDNEKFNTSTLAQDLANHVRRTDSVTQELKYRFSTVFPQNDTRPSRLRIGAPPLPYYLEGVR